MLRKELEHHTVAEHIQILYRMDCFSSCVITNGSECFLPFKFIGPDKWAENFPIANGPRQSPINIVPKEAQYDPSLKALKIKYDPSNAKGILNNGHSFQVDFVDDTDSSSKHNSAPSLRI